MCGSSQVVPLGARASKRDGPGVETFRLARNGRWLLGVGAAPSRSDLDRWTSVIVQALMASRAGVHLEPGRLRHVVEDRLPDLLTGPRLRLDPILEALLQIPGVTERDLYVGLVNLSSQLGQLGLELEPPRLSLDHATRVDLLREARDASVRPDQRSSLRERIQRLRDQPKIGRLLVEEGLITHAQLAEALAAQRTDGGRLGTNLVERGHVSEHDLAHFLSLQLGVPSQTTIEAAPEAQSLLPAELAERFRMVPTRFDAEEVHLAMADPLDLDAIDAVAEITGRRVFPIVVPDMLVGLALERTYGVPRAPRLWRASEALSSDASLPPSDTWDSTLDLPALGARLALADSEVRVLQLVQRFLAQFAGLSAIFASAEEGWRGFSHEGAPLTPSAFRDLVLRREDEPLLSLAEDSAHPRRGPVGDGELSRCLGLDAETSIVIVPLGYHDVRAWAVIREAKELVGLIPRVTRMAGAALGIVALRREVLAAANPDS